MLCKIHCCFFLLIENVSVCPCKNTFGYHLPAAERLVADCQRRAAQAPGASDGTNWNYGCASIQKNNNLKVIVNIVLNLKLIVRERNLGLETWHSLRTIFCSFPSLPLVRVWYLIHHPIFFVYLYGAELLGPFVTSGEPSSVSTKRKRVFHKPGQGSKQSPCWLAPMA